jgi:hypothetical protein
MRAGNTSSTRGGASYSPFARRARDLVDRLAGREPQYFRHRAVQGLSPRGRALVSRERANAPRRRRVVAIAASASPLEVTRCTRGLLVIGLSSEPSVLIVATSATWRSR